MNEDRKRITREELMANLEESAHNSFKDLIRDGKNLGDELRHFGKLWSGFCDTDPNATAPIFFIENIYLRYALLFDLWEKRNQ